MNLDDACPQPAVIHQFALGCLSEEQSLRLEQHLADCPLCWGQLQAVDVHGDQLLQAIRTRPDHLADSECIESLLPILRALAPPDETILAPPCASENPTTTLPPEADPLGVAEEGGLPLGFLDPPAVPGELGLLGGYQVKRILGAGGMGIVLEAHDPRLRRAVAIKVIQPRLARRRDIIVRFLQEARAVAAIEHDNIVTVHRADVYNGLPYLAMALLRGESLETRLNRVKAPLPLQEILQIGRETAQGLQAAHSQGILHRDVKPGNIWLEARDSGVRVKLLDFGLASRPGLEEGEPSYTGSITGTPDYMAPEQARGAEIDYRADFFSLGCVLYRTVTGRLPFSGNSTLSIIVSIASDHPPPPEGAPPKLARLIMQLLAKRPEERPASAGAVAEAIAKLEDRLFGPRFTRRRWLIAGAGLGGAGLAGGLGWWLAGPPAWTPPSPGRVSFVLDEPDRRVLLTDEDGTVRTLDLEKEATFDLPPGSYDLRLPQKDEKRALVPARLIVKSGAKQQVTLRRVGEVRQQAEQSHHVWGVALPAVKGSLLAVSCSDRDLAVWDAAKDDRPTFLKGHKSPVRCVACSADGLLAVSGSGEGSRRPDCSLRVWDLKTSRQIERPVIHDSWIICVAFSPKETVIGWGALDGTASLWDRQLGKKRCDLVGHDTTGVNGIGFSPDGKRVLTAGSDRLVVLWTAKDGKQQQKFSGHQEAVRSVAFSPTDNRAASASDDGTIRVWDLQKGSAFALKGHKGAVRAVAWTPDGRRLVSGGGDGTVRVWSVADKSEVYCLKGHTGAVYAVACAADGRHALSGGADRTVRLWELPE